MTIYRMNLGVRERDDRVETGYEQSVEAANEREAVADYTHWLLGLGFESEELEGRILCDPVTS